ncbi:hypothetical protein EYF80_016615 [Liparis tanakae]|uniref:Uncharacterized protein n=1 Tax=Liparis tanakae TaxID=230148 RepID=A0A4Z2I4Z5_9TELE|nr:hypothetical protein EYF80_016615 [Liparis tanakae]
MALTPSLYLTPKSQSDNEGRTRAARHDNKTAHTHKKACFTPTAAAAHVLACHYDCSHRSFLTSSVPPTSPHTEPPAICARFLCAQYELGRSIYFSVGSQPIIPNQSPETNVSAVNGILSRR